MQPEQRKQNTDFEDDLGILYDRLKSSLIEYSLIGQ